MFYVCLSDMIRLAAFLCARELRALDSALRRANDEGMQLYNSEKFDNCRVGFELIQHKTKMNTVGMASA